MSRRVRIFSSADLGCSPFSGKGVRQLAALSEGLDAVGLRTGGVSVEPAPGAAERALSVIGQTGAPMLYSDFIDRGKRQRLAPYQSGSLRDDFDFGRLVWFDAAALRLTAPEVDTSLTGAGFYDLRLRLTETAAGTAGTAGTREPGTAGTALPFYLREPLYSVAAPAAPEGEPQQGERQFDYVDPRNRSVQLEMERVLTAHLRRTGAWLPPVTKPFDASGSYPCEATVVIPVRNRVSTIADAIGSALGQQTDFSFNVIVVDNHSTDGTTRAIRAMNCPQLVHIVPRSITLGIGGCWNEAIADERCGRYAVQLDSDDLYSSPLTLQRIVDEFRRTRAAMVIGSYMLTDFDLRPLPPGLIDHREWTPDNGPNNALRVNGFGAPRAFATAALRRCPLPDVSYGEDYAAALRLSRTWLTARIYECLYLCRRWSGNSDASPTPDSLNANNTYKDMVRSIELSARKKLMTCR